MDSTVDRKVSGAATRGFQAMVSHEAWRQLISSGVRRQYRPGERLLVQGVPGDSLLLLTGGRSMVMCSDAGGSSCLLAVRGPGDLLGELAGHSDGIRSASVVAMEPCNAALLGSAEFRRILARYGLHAQLDRYVVRKLREAGASVASTATPALNRLARLLLEIIDVAGPCHPRPLRIPVAQTRLAECLQLSRSLVSRLVARLRDEGVLRVERGLVVEDPDRLRAIHSAVNRTQGP